VADFKALSRRSPRGTEESDENCQARMVDVPAEVRTGYLPDTSPKVTARAYLLGRKMGMSGQLHPPAASPLHPPPQKEKNLWFPLDRKLGGPPRFSGRGGGENNPSPCSKSNPSRPAKLW
jgi:hypothetical protein